MQVITFALLLITNYTMRLFIFFLVFAFSYSNYAQVAEESLPPNFIRSIQLTGNNAGNTGNPIIRLGESLNLSFDDIIGDDANYYYTFTHYNFDWTPSQLSKNEYLIGFDNIRILNTQNGFNTLQPYTHYQLTIPNKNTQGFKVTGNYLLSIYNDSKELVFSRKFMVYNPIAQVGAVVKRSRDVRFINKRQSVNFSVDSPDFLLKNPDENVQIVLLQNYNLKTAIFSLKPQYTIASELIYRYDLESSFPGGNEFVQFDTKDIRLTNSDITSAELEELYHHYLFLDFTRANEPYTYNPDVNGGFIIRNLQAQNSDIEADYSWIHFRLKNHDIIENGQIHLYGAFNNFELDASTRLNYNEDTGYYENARLFKQGFYNYKYVLLNADGSLDEGFISGNFDETENEYTILVYYRSPGARYDQIIGVGSTNSRNISN